MKQITSVVRKQLNEMNYETHEEGKDERSGQSKQKREFASHVIFVFVADSVL